MVFLLYVFKGICTADVGAAAATQEELEVFSAPVHNFLRFRLEY